MYFLKTKNYKLKTAQGYTLIETLVAITIIVFATVGPLTLAAKSLAQSQYARDQITAFYLAQEGLEIVRHIRDANPGPGWRAKVQSAGCVGSGAMCNVSARSIEAPTRCPDGCDESNRLYLGSDSLYTPAAGSVGGVITKFSRTINIVAGTGQNKDVTVTVTMRWKNALVDRSLVLQEHLFDL